MSNNGFVLKTCFIFFLLLPFFLVFSFFMADLTIVILALSYVYFKIVDKHFYKFEKALLLFFILYWLYLLILSLFSKDPMLSLESSLFYIRFGLFALFIPHLSIFFPKILFYFYISLLAIYTFLFFDSLFILLFNFNIFGKEIILPNGVFGQRITSFFDSEQILGSFIVRLLPILIFFIIYYEKNNTKFNYIFIYAFLSSSILILISGERTSIIYLLITFVIFFMFSKKKLQPLILAISIFLIFSFSILNFHEGIKKRVYDYTKFQYDQIRLGSNLDDFENFQVGDGYEDNFFISKIKDLPLFTVQHKVVYITSFKIFLDNYLFGVGPKIFREICKNDKYKTLSPLDRTINGCQSHPHNTYFQLLSETGIVGAFPIVLFFLFLLIQIMYILISKIFLQKNTNFDYRLCLYLSFLITLWPFVPNGNFFHNWLCIIYYLPIGILLNLNINMNQKK